MLELINKYNEKYFLHLNTMESKVGDNLPPTSAQSFIRENSTFPALVLNSKPTNRFYHSVYDDAENIKFVYHNTSSNFTELSTISEESVFPAESIQLAIRNVSTALAFTLYELVTSSPYTGQLGGNAALVIFF